MTNKLTNSSAGLWGIWMGTALLLSACAGPSRPASSVHFGAVQGATYTSTEGGFSVPFPVSSEVGGRVLADGPHSVTFVDNWGSRITFDAQKFLPGSAMLSLLETQGREQALGEFARRIYGDLINVHYHADVREGAISFIFLRPASPKTGVAICLLGRQLFLVETDMLPGVELLAQNDAQSQGEREAWLEGVALKLAESIQAR
jgi:hypothetical protein